jgi:hypothetical protein
MAIAFAKPPCGAHNVHYLTCSHMIFNSKPEQVSSGGANCKTGPYAGQPFNCPRCREVVDYIFDSKLTAAERERVKFY